MSRAIEGVYLGDGGSAGIAFQVHELAERFGIWPPRLMRLPADEVLGVLAMSQTIAKARKLAADREQRQMMREMSRR
jgi:hypothetical protein